MTNEESFAKIESDVLNLPPAVGKEFNAGHEKLKTILTEDEIVRWAAAGYAIAQQSFRSWEAAAEFYRVSPSLLQDQLPIDHMDSWSSFGRDLASDSATLAIAYFRTTPDILKIISPDDIPRWATQGQRLYQGTWKSSALSSHFFENSASFLALMPLETLEDFVSFLEVLSQKSHDLAEECLSNSPQVFSEIARDDIPPLISLLQKAAGTNWARRPGSGRKGVAPSPGQVAQVVNMSTRPTALSGLLTHQRALLFNVKTNGHNTRIAHRLGKCFAPD